jgi:hypothetical protein
MPGESMHLEVLVEDLSGKKALDILLPKILSEQNCTFRVHAYKGIGHIPKDMKDTANASKRVLLMNLPKLLKGYGKTFPPGYRAAVVLVCDLDNKNLEVFLGELRGILAKCNPKPETRFCIAIEEEEAWFLGDLAAVKSAFPNAKNDILEAYKNDSICGTWEILADAVYTGGSNALSKKGSHVVGAEKSRWAETIPPQMDVNNNKSPSFCFFRNAIRSLQQAES